MKTFATLLGGVTALLAGIGLMFFGTFWLYYGGFLWTAVMVILLIALKVSVRLYDAASREP